MNKKQDMPRWNEFVEKQKIIIEKAKKEKNAQNAKSGGKTSDKASGKGCDKKNEI